MIVKKSIDKYNKNLRAKKKIETPCAPHVDREWQITIWRKYNTKRIGITALKNRVYNRFIKCDDTERQ